jgi:hypothetical protein
MGEAMTGHHEFQVSIEFDLGEALAPDEVEIQLDRLVSVLAKKAAGLALGPAGAIHGPKIELLFTLEATDATELSSKLHEIAVVLEDTDAGIDFAALSTRREERDLVTA